MRDPLAATSRNWKGVARRGAAVVVVAGVAAIGLRELVNSSTFQLFGDYVARVETADRVVALTFAAVYRGAGGARQPAVPAAPTGRIGAPSLPPVAVSHTP